MRVHGDASGDAHWLRTYAMSCAQPSTEGRRHLLCIRVVLCVYGSCYNKEGRLRQHNTVSMRRRDNGVLGGGSAGPPEGARPSRPPHHNDTDVSRRSIQP